MITWNGKFNCYNQKQTNQPTFSSNCLAWNSASFLFCCSRRRSCFSFIRRSLFSFTLWKKYHYLLLNTLLLHFIGHFPGETGLTSAAPQFSFVQLFWNRTSGNEWHRFYCPDALPAAQPTVSKTEGNSRIWIREKTLEFSSTENSSVFSLIRMR